MNRCGFTSHQLPLTRASLKQQRQLFWLCTASYSAIRSNTASREKREHVMQLLWDMHNDVKSSLSLQDPHRVHVELMVHMLVGLLHIRDARQEHEYARARVLLQQALQCMKKEEATFWSHSDAARLAMRLMRFDILFNLLLSYGLPILSEGSESYQTLYLQVKQLAEELKLQGILDFLTLMEQAVNSCHNWQRGSHTPSAPTFEVNSARLCVSLSVLQCQYGVEKAAEYLGGLLLSACNSMVPAATAEMGDKMALDCALGSWLARQVLTHWPAS